MTLAVLIPIYLVWQMLTMRHGLLDVLIALFRWFAVTIGAVPPGILV
ncbi:hypothetical protein OU426_09255 [Frigidibacter sp. RF13]|nr:hypothetical protein [Frigidibacter sp. RF13]MCY1127042.1 hypothetical protein [Frigidibacter sp. RF13]